MKTDGGGAISFFQLMISFLIVAITASGVVSSQKETVLDTRGEPVKTNVRYYLRAVSGERGMWISRVAKSEFVPLACPQGVAVSGVPLTIEPVIFELSSDVVRVSTELNIQFTRPTLCPGSRYWRVKDSSSPIKPVVLDGSKSSNDSTFTIQKCECTGSYKLFFGSADKPKDIGLEKIGLEEYRMILSNDSRFTVSFYPVKV